MKTQTIRIFIICAIMSASSAFADSAEDLARIAALSAKLNTNGIAGMLALASKNGWKAPWIPDKWHVENVVKEQERIDVANAGRDFGVELAKRLETTSAILCRPSPEASLYDRSMELCGLAEWISQPDGIGNLLLAGQCLDLAGVGIVRLVANTNCPVERCEALVETLDKFSTQISPRRRARILDLEADAKLFSECKTDEDLQRVWEAGVRRNLRTELLRFKAMGSKIPDIAFSGDTLVPDELLESQKSFFDRVVSPNPATCLNRLINGRNHEKAVVGVDSRSPMKARSLLDFRKTVGYFPKPWVRSEEERKQINKVIADAATRGIKVNRDEDDPRFDPLEYAFQRAWREKVPDIKRSNDYYNGFQAYKEIMEGRFFDEDTALTQ